MADNSYTGYGKKLSGYQTQASKLAEDYSPLSIPVTERTAIDKKIAEYLGTDPEEAVAGIEEAQARSTKAKEDMASLAGETESATQRSERQVMVENIVAGLGKVVAGVLGQQGDYAAAPMDIKTSNLSELLAGRLKGIEEKRRTASAELESSDRQLENRLSRAARSEEIKKLSRAERDQFFLRAMLEKDMLDQRQSFEREQIAAKDKEKTDQEKAGSPAIIKQSFANKLQEIKDTPKQIDALIGDLANTDNAKVIAAKRQIASLIGEDPTTFEGYENQAIEARALEKRKEVTGEIQGINNALLKLGQRIESKKGLSDEENKAITKVIAGGLVPDVNSELSLGKVDVRKPETLKTRELVLAAGADPRLRDQMSAYIEKLSNTDVIGWDDPAIDIIQKKIRTGRTSELTKEDMAVLDAYKDPKTKKGLTESFLAEPFQDDAAEAKAKAILADPKASPEAKAKAMKPLTNQDLYNHLNNKAREAGDYDRLKLLAPGSKMSLKGFGD